MQDQNTKLSADRLLLRVDEVAALLGLSRATIYNLIAARELVTIKVGTSTRVPVSALNSWIAAKINDSADPNSKGLFNAGY